ncbi:hypothetical protein DH2020_017110 [Rehmannia glutinosa]|uniref:Uncharacterized protein n=1 Tax=Rehmannia glutinosa TaxID=99300 RepID=A0ABR0WQV3_REHGL
MADQTGGTIADSTAVPPLPQRRPRVREVSSRFMSPLIQSNSTPIPTPNTSDRRSKSAHRRQPSKTDENLIPETNRSLDKSSATTESTVQRTQHQQRIKQHTKENGESKDHQHSHVRVSSRPDTPIAIGTERVVPSRYRQVPSSIYRSNSLNSSSNGCSAVTTAARLLQVATSDAEEQLSRISTSSSDSCSTTASNQGSSSCPNSPLCMRSSMPDVDKWLGEKKSENPSKSTGDCVRSMNFSSSVKMGGGVSLPPHPSSCMRSGLDARKGRKVSNHHEDVHSLKMLSNYYLQWRFANAKAEASLHAQKQEAEMPYLDEWSALEEDYLNSLSGTTHALLTSSVRLPVSAEVRADAGQLGEALISAIKVVELIGSHIHRFFQKAEEMDISISELARMVGGEKAHVEECGYLLSKTYSSQVKECSLRGTLMQLHHFNHHQPQESEATS